MKLIKKPSNKIRIELGNRKRITNLSEPLMEKIKNDLTYINPEYVNAKRFSKYNYVSLPQYIHYYGRVPNGLLTPVGYDTSSLDAIITDNRTIAMIEPPEFKLNLRDDQLEATQAFLKNNTPYASQNGLIQMPTGKGKSIVGLYLASALKQRTLVLVHKIDLVRGWLKDIELSFGGEVKSGCYGNSKKKLGEFITIATIQTINRLSEEEFNELKDYFGFIVVDECHHTPAKTYNVLNEFSARYKLGLTATPERKDGLKNLMTDFLGGFCFRCKQKANDTDILPVDVYIKSPDTYFNPICKRFKSPSGAFTYKVDNLYAPKNYEPLDNELRLSEVPYKQRPKLLFSDVESIAVKDKNYVKMATNDMIKEMEGGNSCIAFFRQKEHCSLYYHKLIRMGVPEELVQIYNGDCTAKQLEECLQRAEKKEALITLTTYSKSTEGTNVKAWEVEFLIGSANDGKTTEQAVGRIRRTKDGKLKRVRVYDYKLPDVFMLSEHIKTRVQRYNKLGFKIIGDTGNKNLFGRGYI